MLESGPPAPLAESVMRAGTPAPEALIVHLDSSARSRRAAVDTGALKTARRAPVLAYLALVRDQAGKRERWSVPVERSEELKARHLRSGRSCHDLGRLSQRPVSKGFRTGKLTAALEAENVEVDLMQVVREADAYRAHRSSGARRSSRKGCSKVSTTSTRHFASGFSPAADDARPAAAQPEPAGLASRRRARSEAGISPPRSSISTDA